METFVVFMQKLTRERLERWVSLYEKPNWFNWFGCYPAYASVEASKAQLAAMDLADDV